MNKTTRTIEINQEHAHALGAAIEALFHEGSHPKSIELTLLAMEALGVPLNTARTAYAISEVLMAEQAHEPVDPRTPSEIQAMMQRHEQAAQNRLDEEAQEQADATVCGTCSGSGEGLRPYSTCHACSGSGERCSFDEYEMTWR